MEERILKLEQELKELKDIYFKENSPTYQTIRKDLNLAGSVNFSGHVGFFNETAVSQQSSVATVGVPSGIYIQAEAASAATAINTIIARLQSYGLLP